MSIIKYDFIVKCFHSIVFEYLIFVFHVPFLANAILLLFAQFEIHSLIIIHYFGLYIFLIFPTV